MSNNTALKKEINKLREQLTCIMDNSSPADVLELSKKLDVLILKYLTSGGMA